MFGIKNKINDDSLYMLNDMVENQVVNAKKELAALSPDNEERKAFLTAQIEYYETELQKFRENIEKQLAERFQFSVEELYAMYGQYENKYIAIEFHKFSESAAKFGRNIAGVIVYRKNEREELEKILSEESVPRTNGLVKIDCNKHKELSEEQKAELLENGFQSGDVYEVLASNMPLVKSYNQLGAKEIPNTIQVKFDPTGFDPNRMFLWVFSQRIKNNGDLIDEEWAKFCGFSLFYEPSSVGFDVIKERAFNADGKTKPLVRFYELEAKLFAKEITNEEATEFTQFLKDRRESRTEEIRYELKRSTNRTLEKFAEDFPNIFESLQKSIIQFETETLVYHETIKPIYWDYSSYLHIYLRHCDELEIEGHFENKTKFQYSQKDIRRILKIAIESLRPQINVKLKEGKDFRIYGDRSLYFNGNHYSLHIDSTGKVLAFHPMENPTEINAIMV
jgi:hypothetical protein